MDNDKKQVTRHITTFANQRGVKIVKYNPATHDVLIEDFVEAWGRGYVSLEKVTEILDVYRARRGSGVVLPQDRLDKLVERKNLNIFVATAIHKGELVVLGIIAWSNFLQGEYLYGDTKEMIRCALALDRNTFQENFHQTKAAFKRLSATAQKNLVIQETDYADIEGIDVNSGELIFVCVNPRSKRSGIGRLLFSFFLHKAVYRYETLVLSLGAKDEVVNPRMITMVEQFGFEETPATFSRADLEMKAVPFRGQEAEDTVFYLRDDTKLTFEDIQVFLDLDVDKIGNFCCSNRKGGHRFAANGSEYMQDGVACGANKGLYSQFAGNYSRKNA